MRLGFLSIRCSVLLWMRILPLSTWLSLPLPAAETVSESLAAERKRPPLGLPSASRVRPAGREGKQRGQSGRGTGSANGLGDAVAFCELGDAVGVGGAPSPPGPVDGASFSASVPSQATTPALPLTAIGMLSRAVTFHSVFKKPWSQKLGGSDGRAM